jgi:hypothetical protein
MATCRGDHVTTSGFHEATLLRVGLQWLDKGSQYIALSAIVRSVSGRDGVNPVRGIPGLRHSCWPLVLKRNEDVALRHIRRLLKVSAPSPIEHGSYHPHRLGGLRVEARDPE